MDEDLKQYLQGMEDRTAALIASELGSLHTDIQDVEKRLGARLDEVNVSLDVHAGLLQTERDRWPGSCDFRGVPVSTGGDLPGVWMRWRK